MEKESLKKQVQEIFSKSELAHIFGGAHEQDKGVDNIVSNLASLTDVQPDNALEYLRQNVQERRNLAQKAQEISDSAQHVTNYLKDPGKLVLADIAQQKIDNKEYKAPSRSDISALAHSNRQMRGYNNAYNQIIKNFADNGTIYSDQDKQKIIKKWQSRDFGERFSQAANLISQGAEAIGAGRGILYNTDDPTRDTRYHRYLNRVNELMNKAQWMINNDSQGRNYSGLLADINNLMKNHGGIFDEASFNRIQEEINKEIDSSGNEHDKKRLEKFENHLNSINNSMLDSTKDLQEKEADMWKYRAMQVFLLMSPVGAFSIVGEVFDYFDVIGHFLGPLFDQDLTYGEAVGEIITDKLGPFGVVADVIELDKVAEFVFDDILLIKEPFEIFNAVTDTELVQHLKPFAGLAANSGVLGLAILAAYSVWSVDKELQHFEKSNKVEKDHHQQIIDAAKEYDSDGNQEELIQRSKKLGAYIFQKFRHSATKKIIKNCETQISNCDDSEKAILEFLVKEDNARKFAVLNIAKSLDKEAFAGFDLKSLEEFMKKPEDQNDQGLKYSASQQQLIDKKIHDLAAAITHNQAEKIYKTWKREDSPNKFPSPSQDLANTPSGSPKPHSSDKVIETPPIQVG